MNTVERFKRSFWGGVKGDVYGSVFEFQHPVGIPKYKNINEIPINHDKNTFKHDFGHFTDDTIFMVLAMEAFIDKGEFEPNYQMVRMGDYIDRGRYSPTGYCFDIGNATMAAFKSWQLGFPCTPDPQSGGNGVLMKLAPFAFWSLHNVTDKERFYADVTGMTHGTIANESTYKMGMLLESIYAGEECLVDHTLSDDSVDPSGFCNGSYNLALEEFYSDASFDEALMSIIAKGYDTDTNACILGQLIGTDFFDYKYSNQVEPILEKFCEIATRNSIRPI